MRADGERIALLRGRLGWDQDKLAEEAGVSRDTVSKLETGMRRRPHTMTIMKLSRALGVAPRDLACELRGEAESLAEPGQGREVLAAPERPEPAEAKRIALRRVCEGLDGRDLTLLLQMAVRMLHNDPAVARVSVGLAGQTPHRPPVGA